MFGKAKADLEDEDEDNEDGADEESEEDEEESDDDESEDDEDNLSDLKDGSSDEEDEKEVKVTQKRRLASESSETVKKPKTISEEDRRQMMAKAAAELPYTFELPENYDDIEFVFKGRNAEFQSVILERMIK